MAETMNKQPIFKTVMCIDDSEIDRFIINAFLKRERFAEIITCFASAEEALLYLQYKTEGKKHLPEVIFLDINMPGMNGFHFVEAFKELDESICSYCNIVMLSSTACPEEIEKAETDPVVQLYLHKPLTTEKLKLVENRLKRGTV
jgi:two-component SAPR family response regulator